MEAHMADVASLAEALGVAAEDDDPGTIRDRAVTEIRRVLSHNTELSVALGAAQRAVEAAEVRATVAEERAEAATARFAEASSTLRGIEERQRQLREVSGLFAPSEGEVSVRENHLHITLYGVTFESGSADIAEALHPILTKVQRVLMMFETARLRIEGHTDSQGDATANRALSQRRAMAVREYGLARVPIPSARVEVEGIGEARPIANNETEEGRARNRRIEVIVTLPDPPD